MRNREARLSKLDWVDRGDQRRVKSSDSDAVKLSSTDIGRHSVGASVFPDSYIFKKARNAANQGNCGSCWAFAAKAVVQSVLGGTVDISAQHLLDCNEKYGCRGGRVSKPLELVMKFGYHLTSTYPYHGKEMQCRGFKGLQVEGVKRATGERRAYYYHKTRSNVDIAKLIFGASGIGGAIALELGHAWLYYTGGLFDPAAYRACGGEGNHYVYLVGYCRRTSKQDCSRLVKKFYPTEKETSKVVGKSPFSIPNKSHWIIINSWGLGWGQGGVMFSQWSDDSGDRSK